MVLQATFSLNSNEKFLEDVDVNLFLLAYPLVALLICL